MFRLAQETPSDWWEVEALFDLCFAPGREALSSYRLREGVDPCAALCQVARDDDGLLAGAVRFWPVHVQAASALLLGPIAVHPTRQGEGLGALLMTESLRLAGQRRILLVGDLPYYERFGFRALRGVDMPAPTNPDRILGYGPWDKIYGAVQRMGQRR